MSSSPSSLLGEGLALPRAAEAAGALDFRSVYDAHVAFLWRACRWLGVGPGAVEDVLQEVFLVVHRRLGEFAGRSSLRTWLYGILLGVVRNHRRALRRKGGAGVQAGEGVPSVEELPCADVPGPAEATENAEARRLLASLLDELDDARREVFVAAELEQMTVPEIAEMLRENVNTVYGRLRTARQQFDQAVRRHRARTREVPA